MKRSPMPPRKHRMAHRSIKRAVQEREYTKRRPGYLAEHPSCAHCGNRSTEVHHTAGRDAWRLLYEPWWLALCSTCHRLATVNPDWAIEVGLSRKRHSLDGRAS